MAMISSNLSDEKRELIRKHIATLDPSDETTSALMALVMAFDRRGSKIETLQHHVNMLVSRHPL